MIEDHAVLNQITIEEARQALAGLLEKSKPEMQLAMTFMPAVTIAIYAHDQLRSVAGFSNVAHLAFDMTAVEATARMHAIDVTPLVARDLAILLAEGLKIIGAAS